MAPPNGFLTSGSHAIVNVVNKRESCTTSGWHQGPSSSPSYFCFGLIWYMPLQIWCFREMPLQFSNFKNAISCHFRWHFSKSGVVFFKVCKLQWRFPKFAKIAVAFFKSWKLQWHFHESPYLLWHLSNLFLRRKQGVNWAVRGTVCGALWPV